ncbi:MAG: DUF3341 domain-containing protein [Armatimonadota bacterium]
MSHPEETNETQIQPIDQGLLYGLVAEFDDAHQVIHAAEAAKAAGFKYVDAYSPFPVEGLSEALGHRDYLIPWIMFVGGVLGAVGGFGLLYFTTVIDYPLNIGGRPLFAWPSFIPITFECTVLLSALSGIVGMFMVNGLPMPYHPVFNTPNFERATSDRFFLGIESTDPKFDRAETRRFLEGLGALNVSEVELEK